MPSIIIKEAVVTTVWAILFVLLVTTGGIKEHQSKPLQCVEQKIYYTLVDMMTNAVAAVKLPFLSTNKDMSEQWRIAEKSEEAAILFPAIIIAGNTNQNTRNTLTSLIWRINNKNPTNPTPSPKLGNNHWQNSNSTLRTKRKGRLSRNT